MTNHEQQRAQVLTRLLLGALTNAEAAALLGLSARQVRRLKGAFARGGPPALVHGNRGRRPVHRLPDALRSRLVELATTTYLGCNHQRLCELLAQREQLVVTRSTLRRVLLAAGVRSPHQRRARRLPPGLMPVALNLAQRRIELLDLSGADFRESFFDQTVERRRQERPTALGAEVELEVFAAAARLDPGRPPDGFLFHAGACGATPLANLLSLPDEHLVIKEARVVNALLAGLLNVADEAQRREREALLGLVLPFMFRPTRGTERGLLVKLSSWNVRLADTLLRRFPTSPAVFLYRPPAETVAAMLAQPPSWQRLLGRPRAVQARFFPSLAALPPQAPLSAAAFYAHAWRSAAESALALPAERLLVLEYAELIASLESALSRLLSHFGLSPSPATIAAMCQAPPSVADRPTRALDPAGQAEALAVVGDLPARLASRCWTQDAREFTVQS